MRFRKALEVRVPIAANRLKDHSRSVSSRDFSGSVGGRVVDNENLGAQVFARNHIADRIDASAYRLFFIQAGQHNRYLYIALRVTGIWRRWRAEPGAMTNWRNGRDRSDRSYRLPR